MALLIDACVNSTHIMTEVVFPPSRDLSAREILTKEGIHSIHYMDYDSVVVNGESDKSFALTFEFFFDSTHEKCIQYGPLNITVADLANHTGWNYIYGHLTYPHLALQAMHDQDIQAYLGSWLEQPYSLLRRDTLGDKICNVYTDRRGYQEWVWLDHGLPIQRRRAGGMQNVYQITTTQKRNIEVDVSFPDSIFVPPKP